MPRLQRSLVLVLGAALALTGCAPEDPEPTTAPPAPPPASSAAPAAPAAPTTLTAATAKPLLDAALLRPEDFPVPAVLTLQEAGSSLELPTLSSCGASFPSEAHRVLRGHYDITPPGGGEASI